MTYTKKIRMRRKRRGLLGFGDAVTDPHQVDPSLEIEMPDDYVGKPFDPNDDQVVATVGPIITGVDKVTQAWNDFVNKWSAPPSSTTIVTGGPAVQTAPAAAVPKSTTNLLLVGGLLAAGYYLFGRKKLRKNPFRSNTGAPFYKPSRRPWAVKPFSWRGKKRYATPGGRRYKKRR